MTIVTKTAIPTNRINARDLGLHRIAEVTYLESAAALAGFPEVAIECVPAGRQRLTGSGI